MGAFFATPPDSKTPQLRPSFAPLPMAILFLFNRPGRRSVGGYVESTFTRRFVRKCERKRTRKKSVGGGGALWAANFSKFRGQL